MRSADSTVSSSPSRATTTTAASTGGCADDYRCCPTRLADLLDDASPASDAATDEAVAAFIAEYRGNARPQLLLGPVRKLEADIAAGRSRHDSTQSAMVWAMDEARAGYYMAEDAVAAIKEISLNAMATQRNPSDRVVTGQAAEAEWEQHPRMGDRADQREDRRTRSTRYGRASTPRQLILRTTP